MTFCLSWDCRTPLVAFIPRHWGLKAGKAAVCTCLCATKAQGSQLVVVGNTRLFQTQQATYNTITQFAGVIRAESKIE